jgi:glycosyltransferase involved in cell wall biosynthesis
MVTTMPGSEAMVDVVLPCLDEAAALPWVLSRLPAGYRAIVADNGSVDDSARIARDLGAEVITVPLKGFGAACHAGLEAATSDIVCVMDADASLDPQQLPRVTEPVVEGLVDLMLGRRRPTTRSAWPAHARVGNALLARSLSKRGGVTIHDLGPMRAFRRSQLSSLRLRDRRFGYSLEMVTTASQLGWRIAEVDVDYFPRTGRSKVTGTVLGTLRAVRDMRAVLAQLGQPPGDLPEPGAQQ